MYFCCLRNRCTAGHFQCHPDQVTLHLGHEPEFNDTAFGDANGQKQKSDGGGYGCISVLKTQLDEFLVWAEDELFQASHSIFSYFVRK